MPKPATSESLTSRPPTAYAADGRSGGPVFESSHSSGAELERPSAYALSDPAAQSALPAPKGSPHVSRSQDPPPTSTRSRCSLEPQPVAGRRRAGPFVAMRARRFRFHKRPSMQQSVPLSVDQQHRSSVAHVGQVTFVVDTPGLRLPVPLSRAEVDEPIVTVGEPQNNTGPHMATHMVSRSTGSSDVTSRPSRCSIIAPSPPTSRV